MVRYKVWFKWKFSGTKDTKIMEGASLGHIAQKCEAKDYIITKVKKLEPKTPLTDYKVGFKDGTKFTIVTGICFIILFGILGTLLLALLGVF